MRQMLFGALVAVLASPGIAAAAPSVATDIAPVQSIVARVMAGVGAPGLIVPPGATEHGYALRPSEAALLQGADLVVWVGPDLTPWLAQPIWSLASHATVLTLEDAEGVERLPIREGGPFEAHVDEADHAAEAGHDHDDGPDHDEHHEEHGHGAADGHLWLDPANAVAAARAVAAALGALDPEHAATYAANADGFAAEMTALTAAIDARLEPVRGKPFLVFHDAYQYFEHGFDLPAAGSVALQDGSAPGAARVAAIQRRVRDEGIVCAFTEPQFEPKLMATVIEGSDVRTGVLDPSGAGLAPGAGLYPALLTGLAEALATCLAD